MKKKLMFTLIILLLTAGPVSAGFLDEIIEKLHPFLRGEKLVKYSQLIFDDPKFKSASVPPRIFIPFSKFTFSH